MSICRTVNAFERWKSEDQPLVLATVIDTLGSTYSKTGQRMLLTGDGAYEGLVSGGCLEGDLAEHARAVLYTGKAQTVTYDMRDEADELWGLGAGCKGLIRLLLQRLDAEHEYEPFSSIAMRLTHGPHAGSVTVISSDDPALLPGACLINDRTNNGCWGVPETHRSALDEICARHITGESSINSHDTGAGEFTLLFVPLEPLPRVLVLGAGRDAEPIVTLASQLGWQVVVADHRAGSLEQGAFDEARTVCLVEPADLAASIDLTQFSAVIVMSHHLDTDRLYLEQLAGSSIEYIGLLGPTHRRERLLADLGETGKTLAPRLHGPVGLDIGANSPESIALALLAEIHAVLCGHSGGSLTVAK
jgi:xanthine/CO dehydrogenase XdhC/CoxF family maturation factor